MKTLVIIVSYNFEPWLNRCLDSLYASEAPVSILVVDNHSADRTVNRIKATYPEIRLIENKENLGFGAANNIGFQIAIREKFDFVFLLNQDAWIDQHVIGLLTRLSRKHPEYGIWSPVHLNGEGTELDHGFAEYSGITALKQLPTHTGFIEKSFINAAFWLIPVSVLEKVGGFSPLFYHYGEDKDYINRVTYHGYKIAYVTGAFGFHDRKNRQHTRQAFFRLEEAYLLSEYTNINYSFGKAFVYGILACGKKSLKALMNGKFKDCFTYTGMCFRLFHKTFYIRKIRKEVIAQKANYIGQ